MDHTHCDQCGLCSQGRRRVCLLKGCGRLFRAAHRLAKYCSEACQALARHWSKWRAAQRYRASKQGKARRREQVRRYRKRQQERRQERQRELHEEGGNASAKKTQPQDGQPEDGPTPDGAAAQPCRRRSPDDQPCGRPGCYEFFQRVKSPLQKFCDALCSQAMRVVKERERRLRLQLSRTKACGVL